LRFLDALTIGTPVEITHASNAHSLSYQCCIAVEPQAAVCMKSMFVPASLLFI